MVSTPAHRPSSSCPHRAGRASPPSILIRCHERHNGAATWCRRGVSCSSFLTGADGPRRLQWFPSPAAGGGLDRRLARGGIGKQRRTRHTSGPSLARGRCHPCGDHPPKDDTAMTPIALGAGIRRVPGRFFLTPQWTIVLHCGDSYCRLSSKHQLFGVASFLCHSRVLTASGAHDHDLAGDPALSRCKQLFGYSRSTFRFLSQTRNGSRPTMVETQCTVRHSSCLVEPRRWSGTRRICMQSTRVAGRRKQATEDVPQL